MRLQMKTEYMYIRGGVFLSIRWCSLIPKVTKALRRLRDKDVGESAVQGSVRLPSKA